MQPIITITAGSRGWCILFADGKYRAVRWFSDPVRAGVFVGWLLEHGVDGVRMVPTAWLLEGDGRD
jgi:hypothetical protein